MLNDKNKLLKMKKRLPRHLIILMTILTALLVGVTDVMAANRTIKVGTDSGGKWYYRIRNNDGTWPDAYTGGPYTNTRSLTIADGKVVRIYAFPNDDTHYFVNWTGYETYEYYYRQFTVAENRTYTANFTTSYWTINVSVSHTARGKAQIWGPFGTQNIDQTEAQPIKVGRGSTVRLTAAPNDTYYFTKWTGQSTKYEYRFDFTATGNVTYKANFTDTGYTLKVKPNNAAYGNVKVEGPFAAVQGAGGETLTVKVGNGARVKLTATASQTNGFGFVSWTGGPATSYNNPYTFAMDQARTVTANYSDTWSGDLLSGKTYTVTSNTSTVFKVTCSGTIFHNQTYKYIGNITASSGTVALAMNNTSAVLMKGTILAETGATLNVTVNGNRTVKKAAIYNDMFKVDAESTLNINAANTDTLTIDGGAVFSTPQDGRTTWNTSSYYGRMFNIAGGFTMKKAIVQNSYYVKHGPAFYFASGRENNRTLTMQNVDIRGVQGPTVLLLAGTDYHTMTWTNVKIYHCKQMSAAEGADVTDAGGIVRTNGNTMSTLTLSNCQIYENLARGSGGAILWNATGIPPGQANATKVVIKDGTKIHDNVADNSGAINLSGVAELSNCEIYNNTVTHSGGAIMVQPNGGGHQEYPGTGPSLTIGNGTKIYGNTAGVMGGGIYFNISPNNDVGWDASNNPISPEFRMEIKSGGYVYGNKAPKGAGVAIYDNAANRHKNNKSTDGSYNRWSGVYRRNIIISGGAVYNNETTGSDTYGAGIYIEKAVNGSILDGSLGYNYTDSNLPDATTETGAAGTLKVEISGGLLYNNYAKNGTGGAVYIADGVNSAYPTYGSVCNCIVKGSAQIYGNSSDTNGGAIHVASGNFSMEGGNIGCEKFNFTNAAGTTTDNVSGVNEAKAGNGGGVYLTGGNFSMTGGYVDYNKATKSGNDTGNGGGFYVTGSSSSVDVSGGFIRYNKALNGNGGGFYVNTAATTETKIRNTAQLLGNQAINGGGAYANGGKITVNANTATSEILKQNTATNGGAIYANGGQVDFKNGTIKDNYASSNGGGLYIPATGKLTLTGTSTLSGNHVPATGKGGGVYLAGVVEVGTTATNPTDVITVEDNYAGASYTYPETNNRNNIYLPNPRVTTNHTDVITVKENGLANTSKIGFSVPHNFVPVIYCARSAKGTAADPTSWAYLDRFLFGGSMAGVVFDDAEKYSTIHSTVAPYDPDHIYLSNLTWVQEVTSAPTATQGWSVSGDNVTISSAEGLAYLISYVNGLNDCNGTTHTGVNVNLTADVDMTDYSWVPIGFAASPFNGTFNGNGHTVSGIGCIFLGESGATQTGLDLGMFGNVGSDAEIKNVFLQDAYYSSMAVTDKNFVMGGLVANLNGGTVSNSVASAELESNSPTSIMGGLVGKVIGGEVHSSAAMAELSGFTMGGLVGTNASNLYNSFTNPKFNYTGESGANAKFVGGLVADNGTNGTVQNCYVRFSRTQELTGAKFGQLAGDNGGSITDCYTPLTFTSDVPSTIVHTGSATSDTYKVVDAPYLYNRPNDNLVGSTGKTLTEKLNNWVSAQGADSEYAFWKRTTAGGYATSAHAGNINDDYPVHKMKGMSCAASPDGLFIHYKTSLNRMITDYNTLGSGTIWLYASPKTASDTDEAVSVANATGVRLYIDEDASLLQADGNTLNAFTGQTLGDYTDPNRGERWHYCSSSLQESAIGFNYGTTERVPFSWAENPCDVTFSTADDQALFPSDMPHINKVDLYCFYEPEYHWLNLKRNTASHWHMNAPTVPIAYIGNGTGGDGNETSLVPGKGYLVSIDQEQLVQNRGTLNNGDVTLHNVTKTDFNAWAGLLGYNLLGNPYQSYLDIEKFMAENNTALWGGAKDEASVHTYAVYDPETDCYLQYKRGVSRGARATTGLLNPHQGFLIRKTTTDSGSNTQVKFTNAMRSNDGTPSFREPQPAYPLVNVVLTDSQGRNDLVVLELGRDADEGVEKLRVGECSGRIGLALGSESYAILFRDETAEQQALRFEAEEEGEFTLRWETANAEFESLTLVDNIEGSTTDMLSRDSYSFEGSPDQYASRFRIVIGEYKGIDEPEVPEPVEGPTCSFAYQTGDQLVVEGEGTLEVVDMLGHVVMTERLSDGQSRVRVPQTAGVYLLRLTGKNGTRTQKIVTK